MATLYYLRWVQHPNRYFLTYFPSKACPWFLTHNVVQGQICRFWIKTLWPLTSQAHPKWSQWLLYITSIGSNVVILTVLYIFHIENCDFDFWHLWVIQGQTDCANRKPTTAFKKVLLEFNVVSVTVFKIFRIKGLWPWPLTCQGHPKRSPWPLYIISVRSNIVTLAVLDIIHVKQYDLDFWPLKVIQGQIWRCQSKAHRHYPIWPLLSPTPYLSPFGHKSPAWPTN